MRETPFDYLVVGGGMAADAAVRGIRAVDDSGSIGLISEEAHPPYDRPPLSKGLWKGDPEERIWRHTGEEGVELLLGRQAVELDRDRRVVATDDGGRFGYRALLLATGGRPLELPHADPGVIHFRTLDDYRRLRTGTGEGSRVVVAGGGFIGSEMAAALAEAGRSVVMVFPEDGMCRQVLPSEQAEELHELFRHHGVDVRPGTAVERVEREADGAFRVHLGGPTGTPGGGLRGDAVVAGLGIRPATELAESAGLRVDDGVVTDEELRTSEPAIWAAGDVARLPCPPLGRVRIEHEDHANGTGMVAGAGMAGAPRAYDHLPFFYSDLFDVGYQAVGRTDPEALETLVVGGSVRERSAVYYLEGRVIRGVVLWNAPRRLARARKLVSGEAEVPEGGASRADPIPLDD